MSGIEIVLLAVAIFVAIGIIAGVATSGSGGSRGGGGGGYSTTRRSIDRSIGDTKGSINRRSDAYLKQVRNRSGRR